MFLQFQPSEKTTPIVGRSGNQLRLPEAILLGLHTALLQTPFHLRYLYNAFPAPTLSQPCASKQRLLTPMRVTLWAMH